MRFRDIEWDRVLATIVVTVLTAAWLFAGYKLYEDHVMLAQVVTYLNSQALAAQQAKGGTVPANVVANPEVKK